MSVHWDSDHGPTDRWWHMILSTSIFMGRPRSTVRFNEQLRLGIALSLSLSHLLGRERAGGDSDWSILCLHSMSSRVYCIKYFTIIHELHTPSLSLDTGGDCYQVGLGRADYKTEQICNRIFDFLSLHNALEQNCEIAIGQVKLPTF